MPRPKGSKNKVKSTIAQLDFTSLIAEKSSTKEALVADIATLEENLTSIREELKVKKSELKTVEKELCKLEEQRAAFDARVLMLSLAVMISLCHADMRLPGYLSWNVSCDGAAIRPYHGRA